MRGVSTPCTEIVLPIRERSEYTDRVYRKELPEDDQYHSRVNNHLDTCCSAHQHICWWAEQHVFGPRTMGCTQYRLNGGLYSTHHSGGTVDNALKRFLASFRKVGRPVNSSSTARLPRKDGCPESPAVRHSERLGLSSRDLVPPQLPCSEQWACVGVCLRPVPPTVQQQWRRRPCYAAQKTNSASRSRPGHRLFLHPRPLPPAFCWCFRPRAPPLLRPSSSSSSPPPSGVLRLLSVF